MNEDKIYLFDLDGTLFDPFLFIDEMLRRFSTQFSIPENMLLDLKKEHRSELEKGSDFDPGQFLIFLSQKINVPVDQLLSIWNEKTAYEKVVYPDVFPVLQELQKRNSKMGIFSEGFSVYQMQKLEMSGLLPFFDPGMIHIFRRKLLKENIDRLSSNCLVIDNRREVVIELKQANITSIWINRESDEKLSDIRTIQNLQELL